MDEIDDILCCTYGCVGKSGRDKVDWDQQYVAIDLSIAI